MTAPVTFYADFQGLASLKHEAKAQDPAALKEAAKQFESLFTRMLLKSMREANRSFGDSMFGGEHGEMYQDMFDDQMAVHLAQGKGLGLADMLIRQLAQSPLPNPPPSYGGGDKNAAIESSTLPKSHSVSSPPPVAGGRTGPQAGERQHMDVRAGESAQGRGSTGQGGGAPSKLDFIRSMLPHAERAAAQLGVDPQALIAQAALETGWGKSVPCNAKGERSFNLFGIKAGSQWSGATVNVPTLEFEDGVAVRKVDAFRAYASPADSFMDYARLIANSARYENARGAGGDVAAFASALQDGGYATDPDYARKIVAVAREVRALAAADEFKSDANAPIAISGAHHG